MWIAVTERFQQFGDNLTLTPAQFEDGLTKYRGVTRSLNQTYFASQSETDHAFLVGSWSKSTNVRPPRDVDMFFVLPPSVGQRFDAYVGNKQSALLQEVRQALQVTYPTTDMRADGQVIVVRFNSMNVEVVPAFVLPDGQYATCDTNDGGRYRRSDPVAEVDRIDTVDATNNNNLRPLVRMLKAWQANCNVPIKSFWLELLVVDFLPNSPWRLNSYFFYDWLMRDFFAFMLTRTNTRLWVPGTIEAIWIGDAWKSRCETAYKRALAACSYEQADSVWEAGYEWQQIFGQQVPTIP